MDVSPCSQGDVLGMLGFGLWLPLTREGNSWDTCERLVQSPRPHVGLDQNNSNLGPIGTGTGAQTSVS